jgi:hypothetical protein
MNMQLVWGHSNAPIAMLGTGYACRYIAEELTDHNHRDDQGGHSMRAFNARE